MSEKAILTIKLKKRHLLALLVVVLCVIFTYSIYFKAFMTLPQSAISIIQPVPMQLDGKRVLVIAPHCDDETLGTFGIINQVVSTGGQAKIVMVTDCNHKENGALRKRETLNAMEIAGVGKSDIQFLDFKEAKDKRDEQENVDLRKDLNAILEDYGPDFVFAPHPSDTHQDHKFAGKNTEKVLQDRSETKKALYYLIHYNFLKFPSPPGMRPQSHILPPARLVNLTDKWYKFNLTQEEEDQKEEAVLKYKSQLRKTNPVLRRVLFDFIRKNELFMMRAGS